MEVRYHFQVPLGNKKSAVTEYLARFDLWTNLIIEYVRRCDVVLLSLSAPSVAVAAQGEFESSKARSIPGAVCLISIR